MKKVSELYEQDKPREKLLKKGAAALKDYELMAVILGSGVPGKDVLRLSREIVRMMTEDFGGLDIDRLLAVHGLGSAKASQILAAIELSRRYLVRQNTKILSARDVWDLLRRYSDRKQEHFVALTLDGASHLIEERLITVGILNHSLVHPREVFSEAVSDRAAAVIVAHNHPSGHCFPSSEDRRVTRRLREAGEILGIELLDHVILTRDGWYSFSDEGEL